MNERAAWREVQVLQIQENHCKPRLVTLDSQTIFLLLILKQLESFKVGEKVSFRVCVS